MVVYRSIECSNASKSIGNGFPVKKYVGAMVRKSIRVVLAAENDLLEVAGDLEAEEPRRSSLRMKLVVWKKVTLKSDEKKTKLYRMCIY